MTYKLNPIIEKIASPVKLILAGDEERNYGSGTDASNDSFEKNLIIDKIRAEGGVVVVELIDNMSARNITWTGEEQSFF